MLVDVCGLNRSGVGRNETSPTAAAKPSFSEILKAHTVYMEETTKNTLKDKVHQDRKAGVSLPVTMSVSTVGLNCHSTATLSVEYFYAE